MSRDFSALEGALGYCFADQQLLDRALTHRSYANENDASCVDNERLEFLGDAVVGLVVGHELMRRLPAVDEGELSVLRAQIVSSVGLARAARRVGLGDWVLLGRGEEQTGGRDKDSILSDAFEAVCAAVYLDGGFEPAKELVLALLAEGLSAARAGVRTDFKTRLQELSQARLKATPRYAVVAESGPDHDKRFTVQVLVDGRALAEAQGRSKKAAEQEAAQAALFALEEGDP